MKNIMSSKIFIAIVSLIIGIILGWFLWYIVYPNLHTSGSQVWTGSSIRPVNGSTTHNSTYSYPKAY